MAKFRISWLICIIACFALYGFDEVQSQCDEHHRSLLLQLKNTLVFNSTLSTKLVEWNSSTDCCLWPGVGCGESGQYVTALDLSLEAIVGGFNESSPLFDLRHLTSLSLAGNSLNTVIPSGFGKLTELKHVDFAGAGLNGQVPIGISYLTRLVTLDLSDNSLLEVRHPNLQMLIGNLSELDELRLDRVNLSTQANVWGRVLSSSAPNLRVLSLKNCGLSGPIHFSLGNLTSLSVIDLTMNDFSAPFPQFFSNFKNLTSLRLFGCQFSGKFPLEILQVQSLRALDLALNEQLQGSLPQFPLNSSLETLTIHDTMFSGTIPKSIGDLKMLSELDLSFSRFTGPVPGSIAKLTRLAKLNLAQNGLSGSIPSFTSCKNLRFLKLSDNQLNGSVLSTDWNELSQLLWVELSENSLSGSIPKSLFGISSLQSLYLDGNQFTGFRNEFVDTSISSMHVLSLSHNDLQGSSIEAFIYGLNKLRWLDLASNNLSGKFRISTLHRKKDFVGLDLSHNNLVVELGKNDFLSFPNLEYLGLASCKLTSFPNHLPKTLEDVDLSVNQIYGEVSSWVWNIDTAGSLNLSHNFLQKLNIPGNASQTTYYRLDLSNNLFDGEIPGIFLTASFLDLSDNRFSGTIPSIETIFTEMYYLSLSKNRLTGSIPKWICNNTRFAILDLSENFLSGAIPSCLVQISKLGVLNLKRNRFSGNVPDSFPSNCSLNTLNLNGNTLQGTIPKSLSGCRSLQVMDLGNNKLRDTFPCWMLNITSLSVLVLRSNLFHGDLSCSISFTNESSLQIMDVAANNFTGNLPSRQLLGWKKMLVEEEPRSVLGSLLYGGGGLFYADAVSITVKGNTVEIVKILTIFSAIDFSENHFAGSIPNEFGKLAALRALNISGNRLTGGIPTSLGSMKHLESLDLSRNELSGCIPTEIRDLTFLAVLNLSFNQLEGPIPKGSQMQTFSEGSYKGNKGLCGFPLKECGALNPSNSPNEAGASKPLFGGEEFIAAEVGYAVGLGLVIMPLMFWPSWRMRFYEFTNSVLAKIICKANPGRQVRSN